MITGPKLSEQDKIDAMREFGPLLDKLDRAFSNAGTKKSASDENPLPARNGFETKPKSP